jgi:vacuolar-type H+-ATPase subunit C/Vma6
MITGVVLDICNMSVTWMCMVDGEDNPELIEKILVMHGKQQQKQQEDLDDAADAEGWIDVCKETDA